MRVDLRIHANIRTQVHAGMAALRVQLRQIWAGSEPIGGEIGDPEKLKMEYGHIILSAIRHLDEMGFDVMECLELSLPVQEALAASKLKSQGG